MARELAALKEQGNEQVKAGCNADAVETYTRALTIDDENDNFNKTLYANRAAACMRLKRWEQALADCDRALAIDPAYVKVTVRRADVLVKLGKYEQACYDYEQAKRAYGRENRAEARRLDAKIRQAKLEQKKAERKDYYAIMGVDKQATPAQIKKAYRTLAVRLHPDRYDGDKEEGVQKFKDLGEAYTVLSDPQKRRRYDSGVDIDALDGHGHGMGDFDPNDIFRAFMGGASFGGHGHGAGFRSSRQPYSSPNFEFNF
jgi:DnaJ homolog subfamily C member 7